MDQNQLARHNKTAWEGAAYKAWVNKYGVPAEAAKLVASQPDIVLRRLLPDLGDPVGLSIANPLGSHGRIATALAILGAEVTVFDVSTSNERYAQELARAANVRFDYIVGDFATSTSLYPARFDASVMELGIVHYFASIDEFMAALHLITKPKGRIVLTDFHPIWKKSVKMIDGEPSFDGDYFSDDFQVAETPYATFVSQPVPTCLVRRWTLGEIVTAFAKCFTVSSLAEHPSWENNHLPGTFTLTGIVDP